MFEVYSADIIIGLGCFLLFYLGFCVGHVVIWVNRNERREKIVEANMKFVKYDYYCPKCKHFEEKESCKECSECLDCPARLSTKKPMNFKDMKDNS